jgi:MscS family membrane protein
MAALVLASAAPVRLEAGEPAAAPAAREAAPSPKPAVESALSEAVAPVEQAVEKLPAQIGEHVPRWARREVGGVALWQVFAAVGFLVVGYGVKKVSDFLCRRAQARFQANASRRFDYFLAMSAGRPLGYLILLGGIAGALWVLPLPVEPTDVRSLVLAGLKVLLVADVLWFLFRAVDVAVEGLARLAGGAESKLGDEMAPLIRKSLKVVIGIVCVLWVVQLLGYSVTSLLAGLGIGGLAVALALQDTLANFFGSVFIFVDRPFKVGDQVKIGDAEGVVEEIGFRSTRIRTHPASLISIPNKTVASATIENLSKMPRRRVMQTMALPIKAGPEDVERALAAIRQAVAADAGVDAEGTVVRFTDFTAAGLSILVVYYTKAVAYDEHLATKERINLALMRRLRDLGLSIGAPA